MKYIIDGIANMLVADRDKNELHKWARIEYSQDAEWAYNYMLKYKAAPSIKDSISA
jgi:hypothetical protein